jgi:hypothetical protein
MLWDFTDVLGVLLPLRQPTVGVGRSRCGGHDVAGTADERVAGVVEAHHRQRGGSGSPMRAVVSRAAGGSTRSAEQRWPSGREIARVQRDGRAPAPAPPPHAAFGDYHHNIVTNMRIVVNNRFLAGGSSDIG